MVACFFLLCTSPKQVFKPLTYYLRYKPGALTTHYSLFTTYYTHNKFA